MTDHNCQFTNETHEHSLGCTVHELLDEYDMEPSQEAQAAGEAVATLQD